MSVKITNQSGFGLFLMESGFGLLCEVRELFSIVYLFIGRSNRVTLLDWENHTVQ